MQSDMEQDDSFVSNTIKFAQGNPVFFVALIAIIFTISIHDEAIANCADISTSNYACTIKLETGNRFIDCARFSEGEVSFDFDLSLDKFFGVLACDCKTGGNFARPEFGTSNQFHCVSNIVSEFGLAFEGTAKRNGKKIVGEAVNDAGTSFIFRCNRRQDCSLPASTLATLSKSPWNSRKGN